ncbi:metallophosphoesterase family protein [Candidatus Uabimicrobium amorphum]|uniref:Serine/threonine protein phosphatase n=1 Tax=Uabimicrobium amorphum TaxID=2596890 RepID=A0A5S9IIF0_UABAM|nr:metallophosphoesterase family protein [Candidatus Uabimicrobium amorphum]BBM82409.1 serine/threonine protein phosphatase [Candidatus Uabimicrobium amorphum]
MNCYVIGDIHGYANLLSQLVDLITPKIQKQDTIVFLGDYIDRGPDSRGVVDIILQLRKHHNVICLKGNHEQWMLQALEKSKNSWVTGMDGFSMMESYSRDFADNFRQAFRNLGVKIFTQPQVNEEHYRYFFHEIMPSEHLDFFMSLQNYYENKYCICVHAGLNAELPLEEQQEQDLLWSLPANFLQTWQGKKTLVMGHQGTHSVDESMWGKPIVTPKVVLLDTSCYETGVLSAIRFPDRKIFQAQQPV